jgi:hypothetical protein
LELTKGAKRSSIFSSFHHWQRSLAEIRYNKILVLRNTVAQDGLTGQ